jgi:hypothetical protein
MPPICEKCGASMRQVGPSAFKCFVCYPNPAEESRAATPSHNNGAVLGATGSPTAEIGHSGVQFSHGTAAPLRAETPDDCNHPRLVLLEGPIHEHDYPRIFACQLCGAQLRIQMRPATIEVKYGTPR